MLLWSKRESVFGMLLLIFRFCHKYLGQFSVGHSGGKNPDLFGPLRASWFPSDEYLQKWSQEDSFFDTDTET